MRILALTNLYPRPGWPLIASFNRQQLAALAARHEVRVIAPVAWRSAMNDLLKHGRCPPHYINDDGVAVSHPTFYYPPGFWRGQHGRFLAWSIRDCVKQAIQQFKPDALLGCFAYPDGWAAVRLARQAGVPVVLKAHGSDIHVLERHRSTRPRLVEALRGADRVVTVSGDLAEQVVRLGAQRNKVRVVHNGVDGDLFSPGDQAAARHRLHVPHNEQAILFVGHLLQNKGAGVLIDACRLLRDGEGSSGRQGDRNRFTCYLVGSGGDESKLRSLVGRYGLEECVKFVGPRPHGELPDWYRASDVVALPSFSEGIPNVLREALACGRPFVATRVGGVPEIAHPSVSRLIEPGDAAALANALAEILAAPPRVDSALVHGCNPTWHESAERLADVLGEAIEDSGFGVQGSVGARGQDPETASEFRALANADR